MSKFQNLLSSITIRNYTYRNRIIAGPTMFAHSVLTFPDIAENVYRMVERRAAGGAAEVATGEICVNFEEGICMFVAQPIDFDKYEGSDFEAFKEYASRIKKHGAIALLEFSHEGSGALSRIPTGYQPQGVSPLGPDHYVRYDGVEVKAFTSATMEKTCQDFAKISKYAMAAGFDGVLIHGGHGFLFQQFLSPRTNHRTDEFGGSIENRARFPMMILKAIREAIGEDKIIETRISAVDGVEGGMPFEDTIDFCKIIDGYTDIIHVSTGIKELSNSTGTFSDMFDEHGLNVKYAEQIKKVVKKSKVAVIGGINSPEMAEEIIASGKSDFIVYGRQGFADPEFPNKARDGQEDIIRRCVRCHQCYPGFPEHPTDVSLMEMVKTDPNFMEKISPTMMGMCAINPETGFLFYPETMPKPTGRRKVLVVGGGVAGMQAAITAAERGHDVTLAEKTEKLGGIINFTDNDGDKIDLSNFKEVLKREVSNKGVKILLNKEVDEAFIKEFKPEAVIVAVGSQPIVPKIPGIENAINALHVYENMDEIGKNVVIVGGGLVGCEVGLYLALEGRNVTVIEMQKRMAPETRGSYRTAMMMEMGKRNIQQMLETKCIEFTQNSVKVAGPDGEEKIVEADSLVFSMGMRSNPTDGIKADCPVYLVGDCKQVGKVGDAVRGGYMVAMAII